MEEVRETIKEDHKDYEMLKLEHQLCFPLYACSRKVVSLYTPYLKELGITYTQYLVFLVLWERDPVTVGDLCRSLFLDTGTVTPVIKKMEKEGYVSRKRDIKDERIVHISLTEQGWSLRDRACSIPGKVGGCLPLEEEDAGRLYVLLHKLLEDL